MLVYALNLKVSQWCSNKERNTVELGADWILWGSLFQRIDERMKKEFRWRDDLTEGSSNCKGLRCSRFTLSLTNTGRYSQNSCGLEEISLKKRTMLRISLRQRSEGHPISFRRVLFGVTQAAFRIVRATEHWILSNLIASHSLIDPCHTGAAYSKEGRTNLRKSLMTTSLGIEWSIHHSYLPAWSRHVQGCPLCFNLPWALLWHCDLWLWALFPFSGRVKLFF